MFEVSHGAIAVLLLGCGAPAAAPAAPAAPAPLLVIREASFGPLSATSLATLGALRAALPGFDVTVTNRETLEYEVSRAGEKLFDVVPDRTAHVLGVHAVSAKLAVADRPWTIGRPLPNLEDTPVCECWADQTVCFRPGDHVAVALAKTCRAGSAAVRRMLATVPIRVVIWSPRPLAAGGVEDALDRDGDGDDDELDLPGP